MNVKQLSQYLKEVLRLQKTTRTSRNGVSYGKRTTDHTDSQLLNAPDVLLARMSVRGKKGARKSKLISFDLHVKESRISLHALLDTGATNNFISSKVLNEMKISPRRSSINKEIRVRLANGSIIQVPLYTVELHLEYGPYSSTDEYVVLDLDDLMDLVLGMPWQETNEPTINWKGNR